MPKKKGGKGKKGKKGKKDVDEGPQVLSCSSFLVPIGLPAKEVAVF